MLIHDDVGINLRSVSAETRSCSSRVRNVTLPRGLGDAVALWTGHALDVQNELDLVPDHRNPTR